MFPWLRAHPSTPFFVKWTSTYNSLCAGQTRTRSEKHLGNLKHVLLLLLHREDLKMFSRRVGVIVPTVGDHAEDSEWFTRGAMAGECVDRAVLFTLVHHPPYNTLIWPTTHTEREGEGEGEGGGGGCATKERCLNSSFTSFHSFLSQSSFFRLFC